MLRSIVARPRATRIGGKLPWFSMYTSRASAW
jgi:hypothetical protein